MRTSAVIALALALAGCASSGPRPIPRGTACAGCGMSIEDLRYACEDERQGTYRFFDAIECLLAVEPKAEHAWLADYDTRALHAADSVWVVRAEMPSPMGGGFAAFLDRRAADEVAAARHGRVARWNSTTSLESS